MDDSVADIRRLHETSARARRILLPCAGAALLVFVAVASALVIKPLPFSDWTYYWEAARGTVGYERGGVLVYALRGLQLLQLPPYATALILNLGAAAILLGVASRAERTRTGVATWLVYLYLLAIAPYYAVVQFDLAATALLCAGLGAPRRYGTPNACKGGHGRGARCLCGIEPTTVPAGDPGIRRVGRLRHVAGPRYPGHAESTRRVRRVRPDGGGPCRVCTGLRAARRRGPLRCRAHDVGRHPVRRPAFFRNHGSPVRPVEHAGHARCAPRRQPPPR